MSNDQSNTSLSYGIAVRFGDEVLQAGFTSAPNLVLRHYSKLGITPAEMMFTIHIWQYWWTEKDPFPSLKAISVVMSVSLRQVHNYAASLKKKGYLVVKQRYSAGLGQVTSEYDFSELIQAVIRAEQAEQQKEPNAQTPLKNPSSGGVKNLSGGPLKKISPEEYKEQEYPLEEYTTVSKGNNSQKRKPNASRFSKKQVSNQQNNPSDEVEDPDTRPRRAAQSSLKPVGELMSHRQAMAYAAVSPPAEQPAPRRRKAAPEVTPQIEHLLTDFSSELHDEEHTAQNISQAARLWKASGRSESAFCQLVYEARALTKQYRVKKRAQGPGGEMGLRNKMPYFFSVLKDLLGMKPPQPSGTAAQAPPG